jgi:hypothetical protein
MLKESQQPSPAVATNGRLIAPPIDISPVLRKASTESQWDFSAEAAKLYRRAEVAMDRFYHGIVTPAFPGKLPTPLMAVEPLNIRTLAAYHVVPDAYGLPFRLTFNEAHYVEVEGKQVWRWGEWSQMETLVHELGHHWQQLRGKDPYKPGKVTHNREFTAKLESLGIHSALNRGSHYAVADADGPFGILAREWGLVRPDDVPREEGSRANWWSILLGGEQLKGRSSLTKWYCSICSFAIRVGIKGDIDVTHNTDGGRFVRG